MCLMTMWLCYIENYFMKDVREDDMVEGEMLGENEFDVFLGDIDINCERCRIGDKSIHCLVRCQ